MPTQFFTSSYSIVESNPVTAEQLKQSYLYGIRLVDINGNPLPETTLQQWIDEATFELESFLSIKTRTQVVSENHDYKFQQYLNQGYIPTVFPALEGVELIGSVNDVSRIEFPRTWLITHKAPQGTIPRRSIHLLPSSQDTSVTTENFSNYFPGLFPFAGGNNGYYDYYTYGSTPAYWNLDYVTPGILTPDIKKYILKSAAVTALNVIGESVGVGVGISARTLSFDGLTQSISSNSSATNSTFGALVTNFKRELEQQKKILLQKYRGVRVYAL